MIDRFTILRDEGTSKRIRSDRLHLRKNLVVISIWVHVDGEEWSEVLIGKDLVCWIAARDQSRSHKVSNTVIACSSGEYFHLGILCHAF